MHNAPSACNRERRGENVAPDVLLDADRDTIVLCLSFVEDGN